MKPVCLSSLFVGLLAVGCNRPDSAATAPAPAAPAATSPSSSPVSFESLHAESTRPFQNAAFIKPTEGMVEERLVHLAPLIVQELAPGVEEIPAGHRFGPGRPGEDPASLTVYVAPGSIVLGGQPREQLIYVWGYAPAEGGRIVSWRGIRMTLDARGDPAVLEVLREKQEPRLLFVSKSLEAAAEREHGPSPAGRRFSIERTTQEQPDVVVVNTLESSPMPLGPYVYLDAEQHDVTTLLCRCSPSQMEHITVNTRYELVQVQSTEELGIPVGEPRDLEAALRLPRDW